MLNIKKYRERLGISQAELARRIGLPRQTLNNYELGKREADYETLLKLSEELNTTVQGLLTDKELEAVPSLTTQPEYRGFNILDKKNVFMVPIFQSVSAGFGAYADDQICGYEPVPARSKREAEESIAIAVRGDSMYPKIEEGDLVIVHKQDYFENGDIVVAIVCGQNDGFVKRAFQTEGKLTLESINPSYPPIIFTGARLDDIKILGVVNRIIKSI